MTPDETSHDDAWFAAHPDAMKGRGRGSNGPWRAVCHDGSPYPLVNGEAPARASGASGGHASPSRRRCSPGEHHYAAGKCIHCGHRFSLEEPPASATPRAPAGTSNGAKRQNGGRDAPFGVDEAPSAPTPIAVLDGPAIAAPLPAVEYLVREIGLVAGGGAPHLLAGYGFSGKTVAAQSLALSLAAGRPAWGSYGCPDPRRVLHVDMEQGERLTRRRYQRLALAMGVELAALGDTLSLAVMPPLTLTAGCRDRWRELMAGRDLMILDSLRAASAGQDENSSEIRAGLDMLGTVSEETKCRALLVHHARKVGADDPGGRYSIRGSSAIFDGVDSAYLFSAAKGEPVGVEHLKARSHGETVEDFALVIADVEGAGDPRGGLRVQVHGAELVVERRAAHAATARRDRARGDGETVRGALARQPGLGTRELRGATGLSGDRLAAALAALGDAVEVREEKQGRTVTKRHYLRGGER